MAAARGKWYHWYLPTDTKEERRLILKLDLLIVPYVFLGYWLKYVDQTNINNAYVSGLKEDLGFYGNELVHLQTNYILGAVLGQLPFMLLFTRVPMYYLIPALDILWGIFTLLQYRAQSYAELMAYRFCVGLFEAGFYPAVHYIFGSWYRGDEIARRGGFFYIGNTLGTLTAGFIQAGASAKLDGVNGLAGWRWMYIICAVITIPIGILGFFVLPGTPEKPNRLLLKATEVELAEMRLHRAGHVTRGKFQWRTFKDAAKNGQIWLFLACMVFFWNGCLNTSTGGFLLWLKSLHRYSASRLNVLGTLPPAIGIFYVLFTCFASDLVLGPALAITMACTWNVLGLIILIVWDVPDSAKWFAFMTTYASVASAAILLGWINNTMRYSPAERSFALVALNAIGQSTTAWTPLLVFKTVEAPRFTKGYSFVCASSICVIISAMALRLVLKRASKRESETGQDGDASDDEFGEKPETELREKVRELGSRADTDV